MVRELNNSAELNDEIRKKGQGVIFIDFHAVWCGPCRMVAPAYEQLARDFPSISFFKVNVDQARDIAQAYSVRAMPTFVVLKGGQEIERITGANVQRLQQLAQQHSAPVNPNAATPEERKFLERFTQQSDKFVKYYDNELAQTLARSVVPVEITDIVEKDGPTLEAAVKLLQWFKRDFFHWTDSPVCPSCEKQTPKGSGLQGSPTREEEDDDAQRVEVYSCTNCEREVRFPRYNNPIKLLETRNGRCGEWANCFTLIAASLGYRTRFVYDTTDHVWTELFVDNRWVHFDACEAVYDKPLLYEIGWGKQLSHVIGFARDHVVDLTYKYSKDPKRTAERRTAVREKLLSSFIDKLSKRVLTLVSPNEAWMASRERELQKERVVEVIQSIRLGPVDEKNYGGRESGSEEWRTTRGEMGLGAREGEEEKTEEGPYTVRVTKDMANEDGVFTMKYNAVQDVYSIGCGDRMERKKGWKSAVKNEEGIQRKVEDDWKMVYLCRQDGVSKGCIEWELDLSQVEAKTVTIEVTPLHIQEGSKVVVTACLGDACLMLMPNAKKITIEEEDMSSSKENMLHVSAMFMGGSSPLSFQHAQLFRTSLEDKQESHFRITVQLK